jgi:hypothetical protein
MHQVASPIWQAIAPMMQSERWKALAMLPESERDPKLESLQESLGVPPRVAAAFVVIAPLLVENRAISRWTAESGQLSSALPEVTTVAEAMDLAQAEYRLTAMEHRQLRRLLEAEAKQTS